MTPVAITLSAVYWTGYLPLILTIISHLLLLVLFAIYLRNKGRHHWIIYVFFPIMMLMFLITLLASAIELVFRKTTTWKGRRYKPNLRAGLDNNEEEQLELEEEDTKKSLWAKIKGFFTRKQTT
ncbi:MAG: hypothetical protein GPJ52_15600 [Candidatus Heimdallarchaeota archaeon]|nr:hypothetical protein [Candidatus Heimdallarchaeota archaeon]